EFEQNPDILQSIANAGNRRPSLVIGFAAETENVTVHAQKKLEAKNCDWIIANDVLEEGIMGGNQNRVYMVTSAGAEPWPKMAKAQVAAQLAEKVAAYF